MCNYSSCSSQLARRLYTQPPVLGATCGSQANCVRDVPANRASTNALTRRNGLPLVQLRAMTLWLSEGHLGPAPPRSERPPELCHSTSLRRSDNKCNSRRRPDSRSG